MTKVEIRKQIRLNEKKIKGLEKDIQVLEKAMNDLEDVEFKEILLKDKVKVERELIKTLTKWKNTCPCTFVFHKKTSYFIITYKAANIDKWGDLKLALEKIQWKSTYFYFYYREKG